MAVAIDNASESHAIQPGSISEASFEWQHDPVSTTDVKGVTVFIVGLVTSADDVTGVTYGGVALTAVPGGFAQDTATEPMSCKAYHLGDASAIPQSAGTITVHVDRNNNTNELWACCITNTAAASMDTEVVGVVLLQNDGTLAEQNIDDGSPGTNSMRYAAIASGLAALPPAGANSTGIHDFDTGNQTAHVVRRVSAGQGSLPVGFSSGTSDDRAAVHLAIKEIAEAAAAPYPMFHSPDRSLYPGPTDA